MEKSIILQTSDDQRSTAEDVISAVSSAIAEGSRPVYEGAIYEFLDWSQTNTDKTPYSKMIAYRSYLEKQVSPTTANRKLSAIRKFFETAADMNMVSEADLRAIRRVRNFKVQGKKFGNRLTLAQATKLVTTPDTTTLIGLRDRAILAIMIGCGLRRFEVANLTWNHIAEVEGAWAIRDLVGKGKRTRTIPMNSWVMKAIAAYQPDHALVRQGFGDSRIFIHINRHGQVVSDSITPSGIWGVVIKYATLAGFADIKPHDLRRTYATIAKKNGAEWDELAKMLGHSSVTTTERYVELGLDYQRMSKLIEIDLEG